MALDTTRIDSVIDTERMKTSKVALVGAGASAHLATSLVRSGLGELILWDPDKVEKVNLVRQDYGRSDVGRKKVHALARHLKQIARDVKVSPVPRALRPSSTPPGEFLGVDLIIAATDSFEAQSYLNSVALHLGTPIIWAGVYGGGLGGEVIFWRPGLPCHRCLLPARYRMQEEAQAAGRSLDPPSDGTTVFETAFIDVIVGQLAIGLLTRGSPNRYGTLIDRLGKRNFLHVKLDSEYRWNGRDVIRERLGIPDDNDCFFAWNVAARLDPDGCQPSCECASATGPITLATIGDLSPEVRARILGQYGDYLQATHRARCRLMSES
jgi:molybdopterin/thiamine biosynthesis adenylyltransferase